MSFVDLEAICMAKRPVLLICLLDALVVRAPILFACLYWIRNSNPIAN